MEQVAITAVGGGGFLTAAIDKLDGFHAFVVIMTMLVFYALFKLGCVIKSMAIETMKRAGIRTEQIINVMNRQEEMEVRLNDFATSREKLEDGFNKRLDKMESKIDSNHNDLKNTDSKIFDKIDDLKDLIIKGKL